MTGTVLAENGCFLLSDDSGDIPVENPLGFGLYQLDTRFLSALMLEITGLSPDILVSSTEGGYYQSIQLTNPYFVAEGHEVPPQTISVRRNRFVDVAFHERLSLLNYNRFAVPLEIVLTFAADFRDVFEVRGLYRPERGQVLEPTSGRAPLKPDDESSIVSLNYRGLDGLARRSDVLLERPPSVRELVADVARSGAGAILSRIPRLLRSPGEVEPPLPGVRLRYRLVLDPARPYTIGYSVHPSVERAGLARSRSGFDLSAARLRRDCEERWVAASASVSTSNPAFDRLLRRSLLDLRTLLSRRSTGPVPLAGIPWYAAPLGRDALMTSEAALPINPELAVGTLRFLAARQGVQENIWRDEEPGKIPHEFRVGELVQRNLIPHSSYFGAVDTTPLFISLVCRTMDWVDDGKLFEELRPSVLRALDWIDRFGDRDGDGLVETATRSPEVPGYQAWRSSPDAYQFPDGTAAEPPLAPIEVQGYVYDAKTRLARLLRRAGDVALADRLTREAEKLKEQIHTAYWMPNEGYYAAALDGRKVQVPLVTSAPGHLLWSDALSPERATFVARRLLSDDLFSGWGVRTVSNLSPLFNPMSYHNGSVWPHDNSLIVAGLRSFGYDEPAARLGETLGQALFRLDSASTPELVCGFTRDPRARSYPAAYSLACAPFAMSAGAIFRIVTGLLGLAPDAASHRLGLSPRVPEWLGSVTIRNLRVGQASVDLVVGPEGVRVLGQRGRLEVYVA